MGTGESAVEITDIFIVRVDEDFILVFTGQMWNVTGVDNWSGHSFVDKGECKTLLTSSIKRKALVTLRKTNILLVDYNRSLLLICSKDILVPFYPVDNDMVLISNATGQEHYL